jgi:hypothetical protein
MGNSQGGDDSQTFEQDDFQSESCSAAIRPASPSLDEPTAACEFKIKLFDRGHLPAQGFITLDTNYSDGAGNQDAYTSYIQGRGSYNTWVGRENGRFMS